MFSGIPDSRPERIISFFLYFVTNFPISLYLFPFLWKFGFLLRQGAIVQLKLTLNLGSSSFGPTHSFNPSNWNYSPLVPNPILANVSGETAVWIHTGVREKPNDQFSRRRVEHGSALRLWARCSNLTTTQLHLPPVFFLKISERKTSVNFLGCLR